MLKIEINHHHHPWSTVITFKRPELNVIQPVIFDVHFKCFSRNIQRVRWVFKCSQNHEQAEKQKSYVQHQQTFWSMMGSGIGAEVEGKPCRVGGFQDHPAGVLNQLCGDLDLTRRVRTQLIADLEEPKEQSLLQFQLPRVLRVNYPLPALWHSLELHNGKGTGKILHTL